MTRSEDAASTVAGPKAESVRPVGSRRPSAGPQEHRAAAFGRHVLIVGPKDGLGRAVTRRLTVLGARVTFREETQARVLCRSLIFDRLLSVSGLILPWMSGRPAEPLTPQTGAMGRSTEALAAFIVVRLCAVWAAQAPVPGEAAVLHLGALRFDVTTGVLSRDGAAVTLSPGHRALMRAFGRNPHRVLPRTVLCTGEPSRAIDIAVMRLRRRIEPDPRRPIYLKTVSTRGYLLAPDAVEVRRVER